MSVPSRDGRHIFAIGTSRRGELVRYDTKMKGFVPFLGGISAIDPTFSRDGQWVAYTSYSDHTLWRSRADGTDRLQLTYPPMEVSYPFISPDGNQVTFTALGDGIHVVGMQGGPPRKVADNNSIVGTWSPDGNSIVFNVLEGRHAEEGQLYELRTIDLRNGAVAVIPSSRDKVGAYWTDQNTLIAATADSTKFVTFDFKSGKWTELLSGVLVNWMPSPDMKYFYYTTGRAEPKVMRIRLADHKLEEIASLKSLRRVVDPVDLNTQISVAPDGSPVFTRDIGTQEIYALTVKWP